MRGRWLIRLAIALAAVALPLYAYKFTQKLDYTDFDVYYRAGARLLAGDFASLYSLADGASPFRYAPPLLLLFAPLAALPLFWAKLAWFALQTLGYAIGFRALFQALLAAGVSPERARVATAASFLLVLRLILDSWTIGQTTGLMFAGFGFALQGYVQSRLGLASLGLFLPTLLKIGPGFGFIPLLLEGMRLRRTRQVLLPPLAALAGAQAALWALLPAGMTGRLWSDWLGIVAADSSYYDASHYGSQSLKSFLLRTFAVETASTLWLAGGALLCAGLVALFVSRGTREPRARAILFAASLFPTMLVMPETFKYSMTTLAFPIGVAVACGYAKYSLVAVAAFISVPGLDIVGKTAFFAIQRASLPLFAMLALAASTIRRARALPPRDAFAPLPPPELSRAPIRAGHARLLVRVDGPTSAPLPPDDRDWLERILRAIGDGHATVDHLLCASPAELLRELGRADAGTVYLCSLAQPCDPDFYRQAGQAVAAGAAWVRAQRRHPETRFIVPVLHLPLAYRRHRLGILLNRALQAVFGGASFDALSLNGAMTGRLARLCAAHATTNGQLALLEWELTARAHALPTSELPCRFWLRTEKPAPRLYLEIASIARDLPRIFRSWRAGQYEQLPADCLRHITADDWGLSPGVNAGILDLARAGVVRRVSVMANEPHLHDGLDELLKVPGIETGLHFNVSHGALLSGAQARSPSKWLRAGRSPEARRHAATELRLQLAKARDARIPIRYVDGHHHIHLVPGWLAHLAPVLREFGVATVRVPWDPRLLLTPKAPLALLALWGGRAARGLGLATLPCRYPMPAEVTDTRRLRQVLRQSRGCEIITHPASRADLHEIPSPDTYNEGRLGEWRALGSLRPAGQEAGDFP